MNRRLKTPAALLDMPSTTARLTTIDAMRGVAILAVCWYHLTNGNSRFLPDGIIKASGTNGWVGVEIFFVISGFVIPYSLYHGGYRLASFGRFILKRFIRLDPPYLVAILIAIGLEYISVNTPGFSGPPDNISIVQVLLHLGFINVFFGYPWLNPVFWTLAIELQYYLIAGLLFSFIIHPSPLARAVVFAGLGLLAFVFPSSQFVFHWLFIFLLGVAGFQFHIRLLKPVEFIIWIALLCVGGWWVNGPMIVLVAAATALLLGFVPTCGNRFLLFFGSISYSLYLLHVPIGGRVINLGIRWAHTMPEKLLVVGCAWAASIGSAWLLHRFMEDPARIWSSAIRYRQSARAPTAVATRVVSSLSPARIPDKILE